MNVECLDRNESPKNVRKNEEFIILLLITLYFGEMKT